MQIFNLKQDLEQAVKVYPGLSIRPVRDTFILSGELELIEEHSGAPYKIFTVELKFPPGFPYRFPVVFETAGEIPRIPDRHVNSDNSLCLDVQPEELLLCRYGITTRWFIDKILLPRLAQEFVVGKGGKYSREYAHGKAGLYQYYFGKFKTDDKKLVQDLLSLLSRKTFLKGHEDCPCGSKVKFKKCHRKITDEFSGVTPKFFEQQFKYLANV